MPNHSLKSAEKIKSYIDASSLYIAQTNQPETLFDSQGYISLMSDYNLIFDPNGSLNSTLMVRHDVNSLAPDLKRKFIQSLISTNLQPEFTKAIENLYSDAGPHQAIINLEEEMRFHCAGVLQAYKKCCADFANKERRINVIYKKSLKFVFPQIRQAFKEALVDSFDPSNKTIDVERLNSKLDKLRTRFQKEILIEFKDNINNQQLPRVNKALFKRALKSTAAFNEIEIIQVHKERVSYLSGSKFTSHDEAPEHIADIPYQTFERDIEHGELTLLHSTVRVPILVPQHHSEKGALEDCVDRIEGLIRSYQATKVDSGSEESKEDSSSASAHNVAQKPVFYHLLTSYHEGIVRYIDERKGNAQSSRAEILMQAQDEYNLSALKQGKPCFYVLHLPVNGYGQEISPDNFFETPKEIAWRNNLALVMMLENSNNLTLGLKDLYEKFLKKEELSKEQLILQIDVVLNNLMRDDSNSPLKNQLIDIVRNRLHETNPELLRYIASLSLAVNNGNSFVGCKSGNERTGMILNRLEMLLWPKKDEDLNPSDDAQQEEEAKDKKPSDDEQKIEVSIAQLGNSLDDPGALSVDLDQKINTNNCNGFSNFISRIDQHADPKIMADIGSYDTNRAESALVTNLKTSGTKSLQAHKNKYALEIASLMENKISQRFFETVFSAGAVAVGILGSFSIISAGFLAGPIIPAILIGLAIFGLIQDRFNNKFDSFFYLATLALGILALTKVLAVSLTLISLPLTTLFPPLLILMGVIGLLTFGIKLGLNIKTVHSEQQVLNNCLQEFKPSSEQLNRELSPARKSKSNSSSHNFNFFNNAAGAGANPSPSPSQITSKPAAAAAEEKTDSPETPRSHRFRH